MIYQEVSERISSGLQLTSPPIALSFIEEPPAGMTEFEGQVPSACTFWRKAESDVFYAAAEKHFNCPIGAMTMGFEMPQEVQQQLMGLVQMMTGCGYITPEEAAKIPSINKPKKGIVYGPLKDFPVKPDLVLMWLTPRQAMLFSETAGTCRWTEDIPTAAFGRPACAALPVSFAASQPALSLGCTGMRTFTDISEDRLLAVMPEDKIEEFLGALEANLNANAAMRAFYEDHKGKFVAQG
jgi:uncharacterized protein (DUF169 family)